MQETRPRHDFGHLYPLWLSVAPSNQRSGFGRVTFEVGWRLIESGLSLMHFGLQAYGEPRGEIVPSRYGNKLFRTVGFPTVDRPQELLSGLVKKHMARTGCNANITLWSSWCLDNPWGRLFPTWMPYVPLEAPFTAYEYPLLRDAMHIIAMSRFGEQEFKKAGLPVTFIPHGVDTAFYCPCDEEEKARARARLGIPVDAFVVGSVGANYRDRKRFDRMIRIFSEFVHRNRITDAYLYICTERKPVAPGMGFDFDLLGSEYDILDRLLIPQTSNVDDDTWLDVFRSFDVYLSTAGGEGFGIPIIEAQACGIPVILPDNSAQTELVFEEQNGWLITCYDHEIRQTDPLHSKWGIIDVDECREALEWAYEDRAEVASRGISAREFSLDYDWDKTVETAWIPFLKEMAAKVEGLPANRRNGGVGRVQYYVKKKQEVVAVQQPINAWSVLAGEDDAKELILTGFKDGKPFAPEPLLERIDWTKYPVVLDVACGLGRNWPALIGCKEIIAYDFPNMQSMAPKDPRVGWISPPPSNLKDVKASAAIATLAFQHFMEPELRELLKAVRNSLSPDGILFVTGRGYIDDNHKPAWPIILDYFKIDKTLSGEFYPTDDTEHHQTIVLVGKT